MKESNFYSDEFEQLVREKTEQYKMYPSEKVWKGIHNSLHTKRRWFFGSMSLLITGILFFAGKELIAPSGHPSPSKKISASISHTSSRAKAGNDNDNPNDNSGDDEKTTASVVVPVVVRHHWTAADTSTGQSYKGITITISNPVISQPDLSEILSHAVHLPADAPSLPVMAAGGVAGGSVAANSTEKDNEGEERSGQAVTGGQENNPDIRAARAARNASKNSLAETRSAPVSNTGGEMRSDSSGQAVRTSSGTISEAADQQRVNWLREYAAYDLPAAAKRGRKFLQFYLSPTVNYRTLSGGDFAPPKSIVQNVPVSPNHIGDAKDFVDHSPALGFETGANFLYRVTRNLTLKAGLQFSFSRYKINAYAASPQQTTIGLNSYYGYYLDSITSYSSIRNFGGKTQETLNNDYYQLSAPVGFEWRIMGNERLQLNIAATIQPMYLLNTNSYLLTTDYTNYTKESSLFRKWNVNGSLEAFLSYKTRSGLTWQIGPEFRYQLLSTYGSQYPIQENLKGYGIKIGVVKALP